MNEWDQGWFLEKKEAISPSETGRDKLISVDIDKFVLGRLGVCGET